MGDVVLVVCLCVVGKVCCVRLVCFVVFGVRVFMVFILFVFGMECR